MPKTKPIRFGHRKTPGPRLRYDFNKLKKAGDYFMVEGRRAIAKHASIRAQASKQGKARQVRYSVSRTDEGIVVKLEEYLGNPTDA